MTIIPEDLFDRAVTAYQRHCDSHGYVFAQPSAGGDIDGDVVTLTNIHGILARYRWTGSRLAMLGQDEDPTD